MRYDDRTSMSDNLGCWFASLVLFIGGLIAWLCE